MVIRNWRGEVKVARATPIQKILSPIATELLAFKEALIWCTTVGITQGEIATDSKVPRDLVLSSFNYAGPKCFLVEEIRCLLQSSLSLSCAFEFREANTVAHALMQHALSLIGFAFWFHTGPSWLSKLVATDCTNCYI